jgi:GNAT superfamily N-acetyltransferase/catechol 2,3-dioxygenase-like lactoylglutathione lyase family enzyme
MASHVLLDLRAGDDRVTVTARPRVGPGGAEPWYEVEVALAFHPFTGSVTTALTAEELRAFAAVVIDVADGPGPTTATLGSGQAIALHLTVSAQEADDPDRLLVEAALTMSADDPHPRLHGLLFDQHEFGPTTAIAVERLLEDPDGRPVVAAAGRPPGLSAELGVADLAASRSFYIDRCGFEVVADRGDGVLDLRRGDAVVQLRQADGDGAGPVVLVIDTPDLEAIHDRQDAGDPPVAEAMHDSWAGAGTEAIGTRRFAVTDPDGHVLAFTRRLRSTPDGTGDQNEVPVPAPTDAGNAPATVRPLDPADATDLAAATALRHRWRSEEGGPVEMTEAEFGDRFPTWLADHRSSHPGWLAHVDGLAVGVGFLAIVDRIPGPDRWDRRSGFIQALYVAPEARGSGTGRAIIDAIAAWSADAGLQYLLVNPSERSEPLYRRAGFTGIDPPLRLRF